MGNSISPLFVSMLALSVIASPIAIMFATIPGSRNVLKKFYKEVLRAEKKP